MYPYKEKNKFAFILNSIMATTFITRAEFRVGWDSNKHPSILRHQLLKKVRNDGKLLCYVDILTRKNFKVIGIKKKCFVNVRG